MQGPASASIAPEPTRNMTQNRVTFFEQQDAQVEVDRVIPVKAPAKPWQPDKQLKPWEVEGQTQPKQDPWEAPNESASKKPSWIKQMMQDSQSGLRSVTVFLIMVLQFII